MLVLQPPPFLIVFSIITTLSKKYYAFNHTIYTRKIKYNRVIVAKKKIFLHKFHEIGEEFEDRAQEL